MRKIIPLLLLIGCSLGGRMVTMEEFSEIDISTTTEQVVTALGKPHAVHKKTDGTIEYEYVERITIGARYAEERRYFIVMREGKVVSKRIKQATPLPYGFDSYEMQTTHKEE